jgi:hypothetical protein
VLTNAITTAAQVDQYTYTGSAGELISVALEGFSYFGGSVLADFYDPRGHLVSTLSPSTAANITLTNGGAYTILVHDSSYSATGSYTIGLTVFGACAALPIHRNSHCDRSSADDYLA